MLLVGYGQWTEMDKSWNINGKASSITQFNHVHVCSVFIINDHYRISVLERFRI